VTVGEDPSGTAAQTPLTLIEVFQNTVAKHGGRNALAVKSKVEVSFRVQSSQRGRGRDVE
jgi:hypothetical protein